MAKVELRFQLAADTQAKITAIQNGDTAVVNTSIQPNARGFFVGFPTSEFEGSNGMPFIDELPLAFNEDDNLDNATNTYAYVEDEETPDEFIWGIVPTNGEYSVSLSITGTLSAIVVVGDSINGQYPIEATADGVTQTNANNRLNWEISLNSELTTHEIVLTKWARANYNAVLAQIGTPDPYYVVGNFYGLNSTMSKRQMTATANELFFGVQNNTGDVNITDIDWKISDLILDGKIKNSGVPVELILNDKVKTTHLTIDTGEYSTDNVFTTQLGDKLNDWDNIWFDGKALIVNSAISASVYSLLNTVIKKTLPNAELDDFLDQNPIHCFYGEYATDLSVKNYLSQIKIPYNEIPADTLKNIVDKFCEITQLALYARPDGTPFITSARPRITANREVLVIPESLQRTMPTRDMFVRNKYTRINMNYGTRSRANDILNDIVYSTEYKVDDRHYYFSKAQFQDRVLGTTKALAIGNSTITIRPYTVVGLSFGYEIFDITIPKYGDNNKFQITDILDIQYSAEYQKILCIPSVYGVPNDEHPEDYYNIFTNVDSNTSPESVNAIPMDSDGIIGYTFSPSSMQNTVVGSITYRPISIFHADESDVTLDFNNTGKGVQIVETATEYKLKGLKILSYVEELGGTYYTQTVKQGDSSAIRYIANSWEREGYKYKATNFEISIIGNRKNFDLEEKTAIFKVDVPGYQIDVASGNEFMQYDAEAYYQFQQSTAAETTTKNYGSVEAFANDFGWVLAENYVFDGSTGQYYGANYVQLKDARANRTYYANVATKDDNGEIVSTSFQSVKTYGDGKIIDILSNLSGGETYPFSIEKFSVVGAQGAYIPLPTMVAENIIEDYSDGVITAKVEVNDLDIYNAKGEKVRSFEKGETFELGDIVRVDDDNNDTPLWKDKNGNPLLFQVTGITHEYDGEPYQELELRQVKK